MNNREIIEQIDSEAYQAALYTIESKYPELSRTVIDEIINVYLNRLNKIKLRRNFPVGTVDGGGCDL